MKLSLPGKKNVRRARNGPIRARAGGRNPWPTRAELELQIQSLREELAVARDEIELDAMREVQAELEESREHYADLYDFAPVGYVTLDRNGCIHAINLTEARLLGQDRKFLVGRPLLPLIAPPDRRRFLGHLRQLRGGAEHVTTELQILRRGSPPTPIQLISVCPRKEPFSRHFRSAMVDLTERKQAEEALRAARDGLELRVRERTADLESANAELQREIAERKATAGALRNSESRLQAIMDNSPSMMFIKDPEGRYLHFNREFANRFHVPFERGVGKTDAEIFPPGQAAAIRANDLKVFEAGTPLVFDEVSPHDDGLHSSIVVKFPLSDADGKIYAIGGIVTDITERRRLEAEVLRVSEREQRRIAQDLHDGLGQELTGIEFMIRVLQEKLGKSAGAETAETANIAKLVRRAVAHTRELAHGLLPVRETPEGLMEALRCLAANTAQIFKFPCGFSCKLPVLIGDNAVATHLYRIAQEAISNAIKHGKAARVNLSLTEADGQIVLAVTDNGVGFSEKTRRKKRGMGLQIMRHRAALAAGSLEIHRRARGGTTVVCSVYKQSEKDGEPERKRNEKDSQLPGET